MKKITFLLCICFFASSHVFAQIIPTLNLNPTQWKTDGNIVDETYFMGTKNL